MVPDPGGIAAISRWLSECETTGPPAAHHIDPGGIAACGYPSREHESKATPAVRNREISASLNDRVRGWSS
ncbi:MAG: hypothetical protein O3A29_17930 [Planctomycetota bacterium]|nr:hypothetical protein [Planctomycetota bacterium]